MPAAVRPERGGHAARVETGRSSEIGCGATPATGLPESVPFVSDRETTPAAAPEYRGSHATFGPSLSAVALGAAGVAMVAIVAGQVYGGPVGPASAADQLSTTSTTTTAGQASTGVDPDAAMAALRGDAPQLPAGLRAVSRSKIRPVLPGCDGRVTDYSYSNGQVPADELCALTFAPGHHLRADAAVALAMLNIAYRSRFGENLCLTDSYRSLAAQASLAARKPGLAARPGTSEHGMGLAVDFCGGVQTYRSQRYDWMRANAPTFGWANPAWAIPPSSREEPWHWEYVVGERKTSAA
jgi:D-alanyl-D-alanine carboxypeptidase